MVKTRLGNSNPAEGRRKSPSGAYGDMRPVVDVAFGWSFGKQRYKGKKRIKAYLEVKSQSDIYAKEFQL